MGGHEIFLELDSTEAFDYCPGHRSREKLAYIIRSDTAVTLLNEVDYSPWLYISWDGSSYTVYKLNQKDEQAPVNIHQVTNPWRTWLPKLLPE